MPDELNPYNFLNCQAAYLDELKNYYIKHMSEYQLFLAFERGDYINEFDLPKISNYICGHLISWLPNRSYFECQYNHITKLKIVCRSKKKTWTVKMF